MQAKLSIARAQAARLRRLLDFDAEASALVRASRQLLLTDLAAGIAVEDPLIVGVDEVGRGCLAGPVVAAAVHLPAFTRRSERAKALRKLNDSKLLSAQERAELAAALRAFAIYAVAEASVEEIDRINILHASLLAMKRARQSLSLVSKVVLLIDGNKEIPDLADRQMTVVKGDAKSASIAAASIIAKVHRDELMCRLAGSYPQYAWHENKGYGSPAHRQAIQLHGPSPWHRRSFRLEWEDL
jgi:ribonuclease HII